MVTKDKDYSKMKRGDLESIAEEVTSIKDHDARIAETIKAFTGYHNSGTLDAEHRKPVMEMINPEGSTYKDLWSKLYQPLDKEHKKKGGDLAESVVSEWTKKFADMVMPAMKSGVKGEKIHNYQTMKFYLTQFDEMNQQEHGTTLKKVQELIRKGHGAEAAATIIEALRTAKKTNELQHFVELLLPKKEGHYKFIKNAAKIIADETTAKYLRPRGEDKPPEISVGKIGENIASYFSLYASKRYDISAGRAGTPIDEKKTASPQAQSKGRMDRAA